MMDGFDFGYALGGLFGVVALMACLYAGLGMLYDAMVWKFDEDAWQRRFAIGAAVLAIPGMAVAGRDAGNNPSHASGFCAIHQCIDNFEEGDGTIVRCQDGMWSHSGGLQGACSYHGGEAGYP